MTERGSGKPVTHRWVFRARFRKRAFGWKSGPAVQRVREAVREIRKVAKRDALLAAEGAVLFLERLFPALERVDSSSGAIGTAVNRGIEALVPIIADAPAETDVRGGWLERRFDAHGPDEIRTDLVGTNNPAEEGKGFASPFLQIGRRRRTSS